MKQIDAVNLCLRVAGYARVNEVTDGDPKANAAIETLNRVRKRILSKPFHFNEGETDLAVGNNDRVVIPTSWLYYKLPKKTDGGILSQKLDPDDGNVYVWDIEANEYHDELVENVRFTYDIADWEAIPDPFAQWIAYEAAAEFIGEFNGADPPKWLAAAAIRNRACALNSLPPIDIHDATGFSSLKATFATSRDLKAR